MVDPSFIILELKAGEDDGLESAKKNTTKRQEREGEGGGGGGGINYNNVEGIFMHSR